MEHLRAPLTVPRYLLAVKYAMFIALGASVGALHQSSAFGHLTPDWYTPVWGFLLSMAAMLALIGSVRPATEVLERWAVVVMTCLLFGYAFAPLALVLAGEVYRLPGSVVALTVAMVPTARAFQLLRRTGLKKRD